MSKVDNVDYMRILVIDQVYSLIENVPQGQSYRWDHLRFYLTELSGCEDTTTKAGRKKVKEFDFKTSKTILESLDNEVLMDVFLLANRCANKCM